MNRLYSGTGTSRTFGKRVKGYLRKQVMRLNLLFEINIELFWICFCQLDLKQPIFVQIQTTSISAVFHRH